VYSRRVLELSNVAENLLRIASEKQQGEFPSIAVSEFQTIRPEATHSQAFTTLLILYAELVSIP